MNNPINILEVSEEDIAKLNDTDLRSLIGLLCEADLRARNIPSKSVTWGGSQDAADGGIDVRVDLKGHFNPNSFLPRNQIGIQVKKPDLPGKKIRIEMCPKGALRSTIKELIGVEGAYIIISGISLTDLQLRNRRKAMKNAVKDETGHEQLALDFYDGNRIASWVRDHPSLILWVKNRSGQAVLGWHPFANWSNVIADGGYLIDEELSIRYAGESFLSTFSTLQAIEYLRDTARDRERSIRILGLSGVGKTRLVQALFEDSVGTASLNPFLVYYCDAGQEPFPHPCTFANNIIVKGQPAFLVIDNCPYQLHRELNEICTRKDGLVSLITIEYDIRDDVAEGTDVFRLEPASIDLIELLIIRHHHFNPSSAARIADFSGGNARIAMAAARSIQKGDDVLVMNDEALFKRLFDQRVTQMKTF